MDAGNSVLLKEGGIHEEENDLFHDRGLRSVPRSAGLVAARGPGRNVGLQHDHRLRTDPERPRHRHRRHRHRAGHVAAGSGRRRHRE